MRLLRWEALCAIVAFALTQTFMLVPGPYAMALFTFVAQPLFAIVAIGYLLKVRADLRTRGLERLLPRTAVSATSHVVGTLPAGRRHD